MLLVNNYIKNMTSIKTKHYSILRNFGVNPQSVVKRLKETRDYRGWEELRFALLHINKSKRKLPTNDTFTVRIFSPSNNRFVEQSIQSALDDTLKNGHTRYHFSLSTIAKSVLLRAREYKEKLISEAQCNKRLKKTIAEIERF